jgi:hypothetical protein
MLDAVETSTWLSEAAAAASVTAILSRPAQSLAYMPPKEISKPAATVAKPISWASASGRENASQIGTQRTQADVAVAQLLRLGELEADWDGNEAAKPLPGSIEDARIFIRALAPESAIPRPALHADGHAILFLRGPDVYAELEFLGNDRIGFYARRGGRQWSDEICFDGQTLPEGLLRVGLAI